MYVCVGTVSRALEPTDPLALIVVAPPGPLKLLGLREKTGKNTDFRFC